MRLSASRAGNILLVAVIVAVAAFAFGPTVEHKILGKTPACVTTIHDVGQLAAAFSRDAGSPRLVLIFCPT